MRERVRESERERERERKKTRAYFQQIFAKLALLNYWKCNFPMSLSVCWLVPSSSAGPSVCHKDRWLHFHGPSRITCNHRLTAAHAAKVSSAKLRHVIAARRVVTLQIIIIIPAQPCKHLLKKYRVFIKYCVFLEDFKIFRTLFSLGVSVCTHTRQVEHQRCSRTGRV